MNRRTPSPHTVREQLSTGLDRFSLGLQRRLEIDLRALAAFRIAVGALLLVDLLLRARELGKFYTDAGVLPREALFADYSSVYSLHAVSGEAWAQALLFFVAGAFALAVTVGYRTRTATAVSWLLLISLHVRNPMVINGGDMLLRMLCFWGMFLPLGERWSIDARRIDRERSTVASVATMALLLQILLMYVTNAIHKTRSDVWMNGEALGQIFQADHLTILLGNVLADQFELLRAFTHVWMTLILLSPLLVLLTGYRRAVFATLFVGMHLGMLVTLRIDLFPLIVAAGLLVFYPSVVWDDATALAERLGVADDCRRGLAKLQHLVPTLPVPTLPVAVGRAAPSLSSLRARSRVAFGTVVPWLFLVLVVLSNAEAVDYTEVPDPADQVLETAEADQSWRMFAPEPTSTAKWLVVPGELADGTTVDARDGTAVDWDRPPSVEDTYATSRDRKYVINMRYAGNENHRSYYANYLCGRWNRTHDTGLESLTLYGLTDKAGPSDDEPDVARYELLEYDCSGELVQNE
ncbi:HTTM domain-containing protein [Haloterrigena salifodinae]|uniref:HTTM domain-containing protein n=1 Tax=Haloterrigena salifodinae TaxID=2675099 RepID=UPI000F86EF94|nr:HTTM domain-containing protein [Haloterrigena salifodinae]